MLDLKPYLATHNLPPVHPQGRVSVINLPSEILDIILQLLYRDGGHRIGAISPAARVCRQFRKSAVLVMFRETSAVVRENDGDRALLSHVKDVDIAPLLQHVKTLYIRKALRSSGDDAATTASRPEQLEAFRSQDLQCLQHDIARMPQLQLVKVRCSLASAVDLLSILKHRCDVAVHFDYIGESKLLPNTSPTSNGGLHHFPMVNAGLKGWVSVAGSEDLLSVARQFSYAGPARSRKLLQEFKQLLNHRHVGLGTFYVPYDLSNGDSIEPPPQIESIRAIALDVDRANHPELAFNSFMPGINSQPFPAAFSTLEELWLTLNAKYLTPQIGWNELLPAIPWTRLLRLSMHGPTIQLRLASILPHLKSLRTLRLRAEKLLPFHHNCPYAKNAIYSDVNHPFFELDFAFLPNLTSLSIEGICNHVPIQNLVSSSLRSLKLHRPYLRVSVFAAESQRSPADLLRTAKIAPHIQRLELDIGFIENLWHPTAIPGVDVDTELYRFLAALAQFKDLCFLRLFPPYVSRQSMSQASSGTPDYRQPCSDSQAIRLFKHVRRQNQKLAYFSISPSTRLRSSVLPSQAMTWEVRAWGEKTLLVTRQQGKEYELRQTWIGERKISSEVKRDSYQKGMSEDDDEGWILNYP